VPLAGFLFQKISKELIKNEKIVCLISFHGTRYTAWGEMVSFAANIFRILFSFPSKAINRIATFRTTFLCI